MTLLNDGFGGYLVLTLLIVVAHESWRWLGMALGRSVTLDSEIFLWVRAVATALVAGLAMRLLLFPAGALADVSLWLRLASFVAAIAVFIASRRSLGAGVAGGAAFLYAGLKFGS